MIPFDITFGFLAGVLLAFAAKKHLKQTEIFFNKYIYLTLIWAGVIFAPSTMLFQYTWTAWNIMYVVNPATLSPYFIIVVCSSLVIATMLGFMFAHHLIKKGKESIVSACIIALGIFLVLFLFLTPDRSFHIGTYDDLLAGNATPIPNATGFLINGIVVGAVDTLSLLYLLVRFFSEK
ncbi:MAG: hypothetical protein A7316_00555 [Candidatus Altiarchaeales archaeon WOR_SM1_86-2]|nr:MAG: hypothetical protein A7316_00555 [Candidatus Altiarchaeales archaeon WOR_SM1_86-2]ODS41766.1 MAG: hypothetical protein A7315_00185 [Candidatus Altiarchaeales archaeon WOR_SM1_79]